MSLSALKAAMPWSVRRMVRRARRRLSRAGIRPQTTREVFTKIYMEDRWRPAGSNQCGSDKFYSGPGSGDATASPYIDCVNAFIASHQVRSVVDLGCGDFRVGRRIAQDGISYTGVDIVEPLIQAHQERFASDSIQFRCLDVVSDPLPEGDLCLVREVLQHLSNKQILAILAKLRSFKWVIVTEVQPAAGETGKPNKDSLMAPIHASSGIPLSI